MKFYMPTLVYDEADCVAAHGGELAALGTKAMLVTGKNSARLCGALDDVLNALKAAGVSSVVFDEVEENPSIETVMKARDMAVENGCDLFVGIGGGSPMDAAKAISLMACNADKDRDFLSAGDSSAKWYPVVCVPTTCGTGSEVTGVSVLTIHEKQTKSSIPYAIFPELALVEAKYAAAAPASVVLNTAVDALCHLAESYIHTKATDYSRMCAAAGLEVWSRNAEALVQLADGDSSAVSYEDLMRASTLAGMAIAQTGTSLPHALSYALTYRKGVPHGKACGQFLPGYLKLAAAAGEPADAVLELAGFISVEELDFFLMATCGRDSFSEEEAQEILEPLMATPKKLKNAPFDVNEAQLLEMIQY